MDVDVADEFVVLAQLVVERDVLPVAAQVVAERVVARVERRAGDAAVERGLGDGLGHLGAGEQAARGDADRDERPVVRAAGELAVLERLAALGVELLEQVLDLRRTRAG